MLPPALPKPSDLFFSRRIIDPQFGARLTGKLGRWVLGGLVTDDRAAGSDRSAGDPLRERSAGIGVLRVQREIAAQSHVGLLVTSRDFASSYNRVVALDTLLRLNPNWSLSGQLVSSSTRELDGPKLSGPAYFAQIRHDGSRLFYEQGSNVNFFPASGLDPFAADSKSGLLGVRLYPSSRSRLDLTYLYSRLATLDRSGVAAAPVTSVFNNHILRSKLNYQFTRELSLRAIADYNAVLPNTSLVDLERDKRVVFDMLLTYLVNPGTAFYIGYTDGYENVLLDPVAPASLRRSESPTG